MAAVLLSDAFYYVATGATILISALVVSVLVYILRILSDVRHVSHRAKIEGSALVHEVRDIMGEIAHDMFRLVNIVGIVQSIMHTKHITPRVKGVKKLTVNASKAPAKKIIKKIVKKVVRKVIRKVAKKKAKEKKK
ncbi:hypothetical protein COB55_01050 [Candidatus Wolfebacteria bacterium]|nr:MAG: hypothetical protein COB55_01050 [Candidatus Wolfebacteria bacterium]